MPTLPSLSTARLVLRPFQPADAADVQRLANDREVAAGTLRLPHPYPDGLAEAWIATHEDDWRRGLAARFAVTRDGVLLGAIGLELTPAALAHIAKVGYDPDFGARPLKRVIQREVSDQIALALLQGEYHDGDVVMVDASADGELRFSAQRAVNVE